jgi:hypothetical protein
MNIKPYDIHQDDTRPSTRLTNRRTGVIAPTQKRKRSILCTDCYSSIYEDDVNFYRCKCKKIICGNCLKENDYCANCNVKIYKDENNIPIKYNPSPSLCSQLTKCFFCLPKHPTI